MTDRQEQIANCLRNFWATGDHPEVIQAFYKSNVDHIVEVINAALAPWKCKCIQSFEEDYGDYKVNFDFEFETDDDRLFFILRWS